jgi:hypothetical protein
MNMKQKQELETRYKQIHVKGWDELLVKLKAYGGEMLNPTPEPEEHVRWLLEDGRLFDNTKLKLQQGEPDSSHKNACRLWAPNAQMRLVTGYALDNDEVWKKHSWLWDLSTNELIETTEPFEKYFGVVLTSEQALLFAWPIVPEFWHPATRPLRITNAINAKVGVKFTKTAEYFQGYHTLFKEWAEKHHKQKADFEEFTDTVECTQGIQCLFKKWACNPPVMTPGTSSTSASRTDLKKKAKEQSESQPASWCDFCKNPALYESVKTVEPGPYAILYHCGGTDIGFIKADPKRRDIVFYCEKHVPNLETTKILWL